MKETFDKALKHLLAHEGGFVNHPLDPGGMTNLGITLETYAHFTGRRASTITMEEMKDLTAKEAGPIYKRKYWDRCKCDQLPAGLDYAVFDFAVNSGPSRAIKFLQQCLAVEDDGLIGPITLRHAQETPTAELIKELCQRRQDFLEGLRTFKVFGRGWTRRVSEVERTSLGMVKV